MGLPRGPTMTVTCGMLLARSWTSSTRAGRDRGGMVTTLGRTSVAAGASGLCGAGQDEAVPGVPFRDIPVPLGREPGLLEPAQVGVRARVVPEHLGAEVGPGSALVLRAGDR